MGSQRGTKSARHPGDSVTRQPLASQSASQSVSQPVGQAVTFDEGARPDHLPAAAVPRAAADDEARVVVQPLLQKHVLLPRHGRAGGEGGGEREHVRDTEMPSEGDFSLLGHTGKKKTHIIVGLTPRASMRF